MLSVDEAAKRQEVIDSMEQTFLQDLARAGANVPPRATVTTALLRGMLWDKREDDLLSRGATSIETQLVKNSRRSALMQLVSQVWKVPKPDYDKVDSLVAAALSSSIASSSLEAAPRSSLSSSATLTSSQAPRSRDARQIGSSAEVDAYEALSALSDAMSIDDASSHSSHSSFAAPSGHHHQHHTWSSPNGNSAGNGNLANGFSSGNGNFGGFHNSPSHQTPSTPLSSRSSSTSSSTSAARNLDAQRVEPIDSVTSVVFRSSPQLTSIKFNRSRINGSMSPSTSSSHMVTSPTPPVGSDSNFAAQTPSSSPSAGFNSGHTFPTLMQSHNRFSKSRTHSGSHSALGSPRTSVSSSPSTHGAAEILHTGIAGASPVAGGGNSMNAGSRSQFPLPLDLKSLMHHRGDLQSGSASSPSSVASDDSDSIFALPRSHSGNRSFPSAFKFSSSASSPLSSSHPAGSPSNGSISATNLNSANGAPMGATSAHHLNLPSAADVNTIAAALNGTAASPWGSPVSAVSASALAAGLALTPLQHQQQLHQQQLQQLAQANASAGLGAANIANPLSSAASASSDHIAVVVPRTSPLVPLVLLPVMGPNGDWFYSYQPISYADCSLLVANAAVQAQAQAQQSAQR